MSNKKIVPILIIFAAVLIIGAGVLLAVTYLRPEPIILNNMQIVLPAEATVYEQTAADELNTYFEKITGNKLSVVTEGTKEVLAGIYIGDTQFASVNNVTYPEAQFNEGWAIKAVNGNLALCGGDGRGVLYSVYHLLEDCLGVRWWTYWEEYVPQMEEVTIAGNYKDSGKPAFVYRDVHGGRTSIEETNVFCVRNRLNGDTCNAPAEYGGEEAFGLPAHVHTFNRYFDITDYQAHPEWFAYTNGGRVSYGQLCLTNEGLIEEMTKRVLNSIETSYANADAAGINRPRYFDISPNDQEEHCNCPDCLQARKEKGASGLLLTFINRVAERVAEVYPDAYLETLAYANYVDIPLDDTKPADNVVIRLAISNRDALHGLNHEYNADGVQNVKDWVAITKEGQLYIWDYCVFYNNPGVFPAVLNYSDNFKILYDAGVAGYFAEQENPIMSDFWDMKFWLNAKLSEDPTLDEDKLIDDFLNGYYGAAGPYLREYMENIEKLIDAYTGTMGFSGRTLAAKWLDLEDMLKAQELIDKALAAVAGDETLLRRVRQCRNALDRTFLEKYKTYETEAAQNGITIPWTEKEICQRIVDVLEEQIEWRGEYDYDAESYLDIYRSKLKGLQ